MILKAIDLKSRNYEKFIKRFRSLIEEKSIADTQLKVMLFAYLEVLLPSFETWEHMRPNDKEAFSFPFVVFLEILEEYVGNSSELNWDNCCKIMNYLIVLQENHKANNTVNDKRVSFGVLVYGNRIRELIINFYKYVSQNSDVEKQRIEKFSYLLTNEKVEYHTKPLEIEGWDNFFTNYPIDSDPKTVYQIRMEPLNGDETRCINLNLNTKNVFFYQLFRRFITHYINFNWTNKENRKAKTRFYSYQNKIHSLGARAFYYFFEQSLTKVITKRNIEIRDVKNVSFFGSETFIEQYNCFKEIDHKVNNPLPHSPTSFLVKFYLFVDDMYHKETGNCLLEFGTRMHLLMLADTDFKKSDYADYKQYRDYSEFREYRKYIKFQKNLNSFIEESSIANSQLLSLLVDYLDELLPSYETWKDMRASDKEALNFSFKTFIELLEEFVEDVSELNWNNCCKKMTRLFVLQENQKTEMTDKRITIYGKKITQLIINFYYYISKNVDIEKERIEKFSNLLTINKVEYYTQPFEVEGWEYFFTNYPIESEPDTICQIMMEKTNGQEERYININFNTKNVFLYQLFKKFISYYIHIDWGNKESKSYKHTVYGIQNSIHSISSRAFFYYFENSLEKVMKSKNNNSDEINVLDFFNPKTFIIQYKYYNEIDRKISRNATHSPSSYLVKFYLFIDDKYYKETGKSLLDVGAFKRKFLSSALTLSRIEQGYDFFVISPFEVIPYSNKWAIVPNDPAKHGNAQTNIYINFMDINNENIREDFKEYLWHYTNDQKSLVHAVSYLSVFLQEFCDYQGKILKINNYHTGEAVFSDDFLLKYVAGIKNSTTDANPPIGHIKLYLLFHREKYKITKSNLRHFKLKGRDYDGGNPIEPDDFKEITKAFLKNIEDANDEISKTDAELCYIVFSLTSQNKIRKGNIFNLQRDCIDYIDEAAGLGEISYISKTSKGEPVTDVLLLEDIQNIKKAINLTEKYRNVKKGDKELENYIFITVFNVSKPDERVGPLDNRYNTTFRNIINTLYEVKKIKKKYTPNNARHTYINEIWNQVSQGQISAIQGVALAGNSEQVAAKHYIKQSDVDYLEATYKISIGRIDIQGEIVESEKEIAQKQQVISGAGACNSDECVRKEEIRVNVADTEYLCLTCGQFATCLQRMDIFQKNIDMYQELREQAVNSSERKFYTAMVELYAAYINAMNQFDKEG